MSFNLNNAVDFARVTNSLGASLALQAADLLDRLIGKTEWQIEEASYNGKRFHVFKTANQDNQTFNAALGSAQDTGGRRKAIFKFPYVDGQTTEDLGRDGYTFSFDCIFFGSNYLVGWRELLAELDKPQPGTLVHPVWGTLTAVPRSWQFTHQSDQRQAVTVRIEFVEHNFSLSSLDRKDQLSGNSFKGALSKALAFFGAIEDVINTVDATQGLVTSVRNQLRTGLQEINDSYRLVLTQANVSFNNSGSSDLPGALPAQQGGLVGADGSVDPNNSVFAPSVQDPFTGAIPSQSETGQIVPLTPQQAVDQANVYREQVNALIAQYEAAGLELTLFDQILFLKQSVVDLQDVVETGIRTSRPRVIEYTTPRDMSLREVAFENGLVPDRAIDIDRLNPSLDSVNQVERGTVVVVPTV